MNLIEAIKQRHSVRSYQSKPLPQDVISQLQEKIDELNAVSGLNMQLVVNENVPSLVSTRMVRFMALKIILSLQARKATTLMNGQAIMARCSCFMPKSWV